MICQPAISDGDDTTNALTIYGGTGDIGSNPNTQLQFAIKVNGDISSSGRSLSMARADAKLQSVTTDYVTLKSAITSTTPSTRAVTKKYVDDSFNHLVDNNYYAPVGSIMMWLGSRAPTGWWFLSGGSFNTSTYPELHGYFRNYVSTYNTGVLPNWNDRYFVQSGPKNGQDLGGKIPWRTCVTFEGEDQIKVENSNVPMPVLRVRSGSGAGTGTGQNLLRPLNSSASSSEYDIPKLAGTTSGNHGHVFEGGHKITRPDSVIGRYIIRGDYK